MVSEGLSFFSTDDVCGVTSKPNVEIAALFGAPQMADIEDGSLANGSPQGRTPIVGSTILAFKHLHQEAQSPGNRFVVLVTDGADSCMDRYASEGVSGDVVARLLDDELPKAASVNIRTFVIGAPGSEEARGFLSRIAFAGGSAKDPSCDHESVSPAPGAACHFDMTQTTDFSKDLSDALKRITGQAAIRCEFDVPVPESGGKVDPNSVNADYYQAGNRTAAAKQVPLS